MHLPAKYLFLLVLFTGIFITTFGYSQVEAAAGILEQINFQGKVVTKTSGTNIVDGSYSFTFQIYSVSSGGSAIWTETKSLTVTNGIFQTMLGDTTALPGSIDFNTDNLYLGVNFNSDGEMSPRIRLAAVPYAFNAARVGGLTVTDTNGTLTIPNGVTFSIGGTDDLTLTTTGVTEVTLPATGTLATLAGTEIFTNKTVGSTGLVFSGATTDITTATNENLTLTADGSGDIIIDTDAGTTFTISSLNCTSNTNGGALTADATGLITCSDDDGGGGSTTLSSAYAADVDGSDATITLSSTDDSIIITNPSSSGTDSSFVFQINQNNTTAAVKALDIVQLSNAANGLNLTADSIDTETGLAINADGLTTGKGLTISSSSTAFTGALALINLKSSDAAVTGNLLKLANEGTGNSNTSFYIDHRATGTGNLAMRVDDESGDTSPFIIDGEGRVGVGTSTITGSTERLLQVGSPTNRGNTAVYGEIISKGVTDITALSNIKDVYLYDTTADSDGGRWVDWATTDQLSWFTEGLDDGPNDACNIASDDRCYKSSFPRKALLVATLDDLYIFDAGTGDMWMKFSQNASSYALGIATNNDISSVTALNGVVYVATNGSANSGLYVLDFVNDRMWNIDGTDRSSADKGIVDRNSAVAYSSDNTTAFDLSVTGAAAEWEDLNDISVVYITGSSTAIAIGGTTNTSPGSGQTFVALATDSGITVINMTAQKVLQYSETAADDYTAVALTRRGRMYALNTSTDQLEKWLNYDTDKITEVGGNPDARYDETAGPALWSSAVNLIAGNPDALEVIERGSLADDTSDIIYVGHSLGLTEIHDHATSTNGWAKYFDTTRQTMLMPNANDMALPMDDTSGTQANDASFNNTDMAILGTPTLGVSGVRGTAINFDNTNDYLCSDANQNNACDLDTSFNMSTTGWTMSMWFRHSTTAPAAGADTLFEKCVTATPGQATGCVIAYMTTTGTIVAAIDDDATWTRPDVGAASYDITATSSLTYNDNQWHQLILSRTNANDMDVYIDGNPMNLSNATGVTLTMDGSQIVTIGGSCSTTVGANCAAANATNFWDGQIDDVTFSASSGTVGTFSALQARRFYNDARPLIAKKVINVANATTATASTIGDSGESWIPNEFAGMYVTITADTGVGQTRRVKSNTSTVLTVTQDFDTPPDTTSDFEIDPEALYGSTNIVTAVGITAELPLGQARQMCVGTSDGSDGGGVTCYNHQAGPNIIAQLMHSGTKTIDDFSTTWTGTDYDDIKSVDMSGRALIVGSQAHLYLETEDIALGQGLDYVSNQLFNIRGELINDGILLTGSTALEVGFTGGADLAEYYYSNNPLTPGDIVALDASLSAGIKQTNAAYQSDVLGVVTTTPGLVLGSKADNAYGVALVGRVPVKVITQNGEIKVGDRITSSDVPGFGMRATKAGRVLGVVISEFIEDTTLCAVTDLLPGERCGVVDVFVNLTDYYGASIDLVIGETATSDIVTPVSVDDLSANNSGLTGATTEIATLSQRSLTEKQNKILEYLSKQRKEALESAKSLSEIYTDRISVTNEVISPNIVTDLLIAKKIKADEIQGLEMYTDRVSSLQDLYTQLNKEMTNIVDSSTSPATNLKLSDIELSNGLVVLGKADFRAESIFSGLVSYLKKVVFKDTVEFETAPTFSADTAGFTKIKEGDTQVDISFDKAYAEDPIVQVSLLPSKERLEDDAHDIWKIQYVIADVDSKGFTIRLKEPIDFDVSFSWIAISAKTSKKSDDSYNDIETPEVILEVPIEEPVGESTISVSEPSVL
ncbi:hypothetical protein KAZ57_00130 [Patescibacteria group bacterium]|nr:hypothetical protein [Patescibacteria group bacterium]